MRKRPRRKESIPMRRQLRGITAAQGCRTYFCDSVPTSLISLQVVGSKPESVRSVRAHPFRTRPSSS